jgi:hypothetical protein
MGITSFRIKNFTIYINNAIKYFMQYEQLSFPGSEADIQPTIDIDALASRIGYQAGGINYPPTATERWQEEIGGSGRGHHCLQETNERKLANFRKILAQSEK